MRISQISVTPVNIPLAAPIRWAYGVRTGVTRNIVQITTDEGLVGLGETRGGDAITALTSNLGQRLMGENPFDIEKILAQFEISPFFYGYNGYSAIAGIEMALWDIKGKATEHPLYDLLGGLYRRHIPFSAYVFYRYRDAHNGAGETEPGEIVDYCRQLIGEYGFKVLKLKGGVFPPEHDIAVIKALREAFGRGVALRLDPNGVWTPQTTMRVGRELLDYDLEYLEDPTSGIEGMSAVRRDLPIPLSTNMCVVEFEHIPLAVRSHAVDVILGDPHKWGGIWRTKELAAICRTFQLGFSLHSGAELGISTSAYLHIAASTPHLLYAIDGHYHHQVDDIITGGKLAYIEGGMNVPDGPGLGVVLDKDKFDYYSARAREEGSRSETSDSSRPSWFPTRQIW